MEYTKYQFEKNQTKKNSFYYTIISFGIEDWKGKWITRPEPSNTDHDDDRLETYPIK